MADWSDLVGMTLAQAQKRAESYGSNIAVIRIAEAYVTPEIDRTRNTVLISVNESGPQAIVVATHGVEHPDSAVKQEA